MQSDTDHRDPETASLIGKHLLFPAIAILLVAGGVAALSGRPDISDPLWIAGTAAALISSSLEMAGRMRRGEFGLDLIAALAMAGALVLGEHLAGIIIAVMFTGGEALEDFAQRRAQRELTALLSRVSRTAAKYLDGGIEEVPIERLAVGDRILVRHGEVVPVDGSVSTGSALIDESALTGEAIPVRRTASQPVMSGAINAGDPFDLQVMAPADQSTYAGIVRMVREAQSSKAPMARLADRFAIAFLPLTLALAGIAWLLSGSPDRALAVLVVATPCPLILAVPVAIISGVSRCAGKGVLVKGGGALETLAQVRTVLFDKTGTLTAGSNRLVELKVRDGVEASEMLRLAASLDQVSQHVIAEALVAAARERGLELSPPSDVTEIPGEGIEGRVGERKVVVGGRDFVAGKVESPDFHAELDRWAQRMGTISVLVAIDGALAGALLFADEVRPEAGTVLRRLRDAGAKRIVLATGDRSDLAANIASFLGLDQVVAEMKPDDKIRMVQDERTAHGPVMMVGDGVNDAPALAAADIGVAMGARGAAASSEAADVVILLDRLDRLASAVGIARRSRSIALQSVYAGMGMSLAAMIVAALGHLEPVEGAILQEVIDVAVILNALRALRGPVWDRAARGRMPESLLSGLEHEHQELADVLDALNATADRSRHLPGAELRTELEALERMLKGRLLPHEAKDDREIYARIRGNAGDDNALAGMSRTHMEINRMVHNLQSMREALGQSEPSEIERYELQRLLHGLSAVTRLHFAQEEEIYRALESD